jgi:hypothetical protein
MLTSINIFKTIIILLILSCGSIVAQDIEATLNTDDGTSGFVVKNNSGDPILSARGNGNIGIGKLSSSYLFEIGSFVGLGSQTGRSIKISAENQGSGGNAGNLFLTSGYHASGIINAGEATINLFGGNGSEVGGEIEIRSGNGGYRGGDILIETGQTVSDGNRTGNVNIKTGNTTNNIAGNIELRCGDGGMTGGSISLIAGNSTATDNPGNINLTPGTDYSGIGLDGLVVINGSGTYSGTWTNVSDGRLKKNIINITNSIEHILQLRPVRYEMKVEEFPEMHLENGEQIGLIAQEVEEVLPEIVRTDSDGMKSVDYSKLSVVLIEATKEQQKKINSLEERIEKLEKLLYTNN